MSVLIGRSTIAAAIVGQWWAALASPVLGGVKDYEFQLVQGEVKKGGATVTVRLVDKRANKPVPDAVIFAKRIDMAPDSMPEMAARIEQLPSTEAGEYRFKTHFSMEGSWQLSLGAKVQGETGTVETKLIVKVLP
jgi:hypothetical protein